MWKPRLRLHLFFLGCFTSLATGRYDIVYSLYHTDGYASSIVRFIKRTKYIFQIITPPTSIFRRHVVDKWMLYGAMRRADLLLSPSRYVRECLKEEWGFESKVIPIPVDGSFFRPIFPRKMDRPRILFSGSLNDPRKGVDLLVEAFNYLIQKVPSAVLQLSGQVSPDVEQRLWSRILPAAKEAVHFLGPGKQEEMPGLYSEASVTVLPSVFEAQGMVLSESLACGTPVVGTLSGGIPETISDPRIGTLFMPNPPHAPTNAEDLCEAILRTMELSKDPETARRCREHAMSYSWEAIGPKIEDLYFSVLGEKRTSA
jgi:phosphatidylinositol alpha-mannosyltransferase